jgi:hypothetical protein
MAGVPRELDRATAAAQCLHRRRRAMRRRRAGEPFASDIVSTSDGVGFVRAARVPVAGRERVAKFIAAVAALFWSGVTLRWVEAMVRRPCSCHAMGWPLRWSRSAPRAGHRRDSVDHETELAAIASASEKASRVTRHISESAGRSASFRWREPDADHVALSERSRWAFASGTDSPSLGSMDSSRHSQHCISFPYRFELNGPQSANSNACLSCHNTRPCPVMASTCKQSGTARTR